MKVCLAVLAALMVVGCADFRVEGTVCVTRGEWSREVTNSTVTLDGRVHYAECGGSTKLGHHQDEGDCKACFGTGRACEEIEDTRVDEIIEQALSAPSSNAAARYASPEYEIECALALAVHRGRQERNHG